MVPRGKHGKLDVVNVVDIVDIGRCNRVGSGASGPCSGCTVSRLCQLRTVHYLDHLSSFECPSHILALWGRKTACVPYLSWVPAPFGQTCMEAQRVGVPRAPSCRIGCNVETWSPILGQDFGAYDRFGKG